MIPDILGPARQFWDDLLDDCNFPTNATRYVAFNSLVAAYSEPHRFYHNLEHVVNVLDDLDICEERHKETEIIFAAWYHDVVYDPRRSDNEERSAEIARNALMLLQIDGVNIDRVVALIMMTKNHQPHLDDADALLFMDADLSILGMQSSVYAKYAADIRKEYAFVSDRDFCGGRRKVLLEIVKRPRIYGTDWHRKQFEETARLNITTEIAELDEKLRALPS